MDPSVYLAARRFADPETGYSEKDLEDMHAAFKEAKYSLGFYHIIHLLGVRPKDIRAQLQGRAISEGWSVSRLKLEIAQLFVPWPSGGRRRELPGGLTALLAQLEARCASWQRWEAQLGQVPADGETPEDEKKSLLSKLPEEMKTKIGLIGTSIGELANLVEKEFKGLEPGRQFRNAPTADTEKRGSRRSTSSDKPG